MLNTPYKPVVFTGNPIIDQYINDLERFPHFFVLACVMDLQIKAEKAWRIPYEISQVIGSPDFISFTKLNINELKDIFNTRRLHRFNNKLALNFYKAVQRINTDYNGDAALIWKDNFSCSTIIQRFLQFEGVGIKIAAMAANCLIREYKIPLKDKSFIDVSPDVHVRRVFSRIGLVNKNPSVTEVVYSARALYPEYPGAFDLPTWEIGRSWCRPGNPECINCDLLKCCKKIFK
jgi:endonuclease III